MKCKVCGKIIPEKTPCFYFSYKNTRGFMRYLMWCAECQGKPALEVLLTKHGFMGKESIA